MRYGQAGSAMAQGKVSTPGKLKAPDRTTANSVPAASTSA